ncbi:hypothetical protein PT974_00257 [Cladobotryum mycophilum]|uniref:Uncharacterized protein n=1 Tax=Cladobotryum mycophilum TaxID=491253 RepID=A0ABR0T1P2_9HYPO
MAYYEKVRTISQYRKFAASPDVADLVMSFDKLQQSEHWESAGSRWGLPHLLACKVICREHSILPIFEKEISTTLQEMPESQIVQKYEKGGLGYVWAALAPLLRSDWEKVVSSSSSRPERVKRAPILYGDPVPSDSAIPDSRPDTASSAPSSVGHLMGATAPLVEEYTSHFLSFFVRYVINNAQPANKQKPYVEFCDQRKLYAHTWTLGGTRLEAIDDGGIQVRNSKRPVQVAILEAKRTFQTVDEGKPAIGDKLLGQILAEALALSLSNQPKISATDIICIVAIKHFVKIFHFKIPDRFGNVFASLSLSDDDDDATDEKSFLWVDSTVWFDATTRAGRKYFVRHLLALINWADETAAA